MTRTLLAVLGSFLLLGGMIYLLASGERRRSPSASGAELEPLVLFCAASNRAVIEKVRDEYQSEYGREIQIQYGPSQTLLSSIEVGKLGDLYLPADDSFLEMGREQSLIAEIIPIARMQAVIAVRKGNPKGVKSFADLLCSHV